MKTLGLLLLLCAIASPSLAAMKPNRLLCEYLHNPLGIDALHPRLSWQLESVRRGAIQSAYQIRVARKEATLNAGQADLWDSGKVASSRTVQIAYSGKPLQSWERCVWQVRVWDENQQPSAWSTAASWEMGLLSSQDWHGTWIGRTDDTAYHPAPLLRRTFALNGKIRRARLALCGLGYYELRCNGKKVGDHVLDPGYTRFDRRDLYVTYDLAPYLKPGRNALGVLLGTGWYNVHTRAVWYFDRAPWRAAPKMRMELVIEYTDGRVEHVSSDTQWKTQTGPIVLDSIYGGETYDARLEKPGWDTPEYDDSGWQPAQVVSAPGGVLSSQQMPPIKIAQTITPIKVTEPKPGLFLFDMGLNFAGHVRLTVSGPAGATVTMRYGERLHPDGTLDQTHLAQHQIKTDPPQPFQTDAYILKGSGVETWEPRFVYHGFQYVEVTGFPGRPTLDSLRGQFVHSAVESVGEFSCSNPLLNRIWQNTRRSYLSNLLSIPTDCPHREKNGWTGDAHLAAEQGLFNFDSIKVYEKWIDDLGDEQRPTGELPGIVPSSGWGYEWGNGPAWDSAFLLIPWYLYTYYGDPHALEVHYEGLRRYVDYLTGRADHGIVSIGLGDWVPYETETPVELTSTGYYYRDVQIVAQTAALLGKTEEAKKYADLADSIRRAFHARFFDAKTGSYANGGQTSLSCALYQELAMPEDKPAILNALVANVERRDNHIDTGILGAKYVLNALTENGRTDVAYRIASQKTLPGWGYWLEQGATTLWESWRGTDSRNHIMFGDISAWFVKALAGINPDPAAPGFQHIRIHPHIAGDLTAARAQYDSIRGRIVSDWKLTDGTLTLHVQIPANTTATVYVPTSDAEKVTESGKPAEKAEGVKFLKMESGCAVYEIGSGNYMFTIHHR